MAYSRSTYRLDLESRVTALRAEAGQAQKKLAATPDLRDMVFQCAIFQTSAAMETYLKLIIEGWAQSLRANALGSSLPPATRGYIASKRLQNGFSRYNYLKEEAALIQYISQENLLWPFMNGDSTIPVFFDGKALHDGSAYPSFKNLKKLFYRIGISDISDKLDRELRRDTETLIDAFQSIRTALAHSAPPTITIKDVRDRLDDCLKLIGALDRVLYRHIMSHGGAICWR